MRKLFIIIAVTTLFFSCNTFKTENEKPIISVSIFPEKYFVEQIAGDDFIINVAVAPGASHSDYDPTPTEMNAIHKSIAYFKIGGIGFEYTTLPRICSSNSKIKIYNLSEGVDFEGSNEQHCCEHHGVDPHIWLSPKMVKTISENIFKAVSELNPQKKECYQVNLNRFLERLESLDSTISAQLQPCNNRSFMIYHPALTYFAKDYHLEQIAIEMDGKEPTAAWMQEVSRQIFEKNIKLIFIQSQYDTNNAKAISDATGAKLIVIDPMSEHWMEEIEKITNNLLENCNL